MKTIYYALPKGGLWLGPLIQIMVNNYMAPLRASRSKRVKAVKLGQGCI